MIGRVTINPSTSVPAGSLLCEGAAVSRTTYAELFEVIGTTYGIGNGSTTFNLPDMRGVFVRGWAHGSADDPDRASRTNRGDGVTGDRIGTRQVGHPGSHRHYGSHVANWGNYNSNTVASGFSGYTNAPSGDPRPPNINVRYCIQYE